jgi:hypothetical protein
VEAFAPRVCGCPRNCERRVHARRATGKPGRAILIGGIETLGLIAGELNLQGWFWDRINDLNNNFGLLGYGIIGIFAAAWVISFIAYRAKKLDEVEIG